KDRLANARMLDKWPAYHDRTSRLQGICKKYNVEKVRKCSRLAGYEFLGMTDMHFKLPEYGTGILDEFYQLKPGDTIEIEIPPIGVLKNTIEAE
ncbi:MAG: hypothetical protein HQ514_00635, partial [Rhodospirillales bacterium]|nr:hypothetical protein [Rhodospirillales bacterium]